MSPILEARDVRTLPGSVPATSKPCAAWSLAVEPVSSSRSWDRRVPARARCSTCWGAGPADLRRCRARRRRSSAACPTMPATSLPPREDGLRLPVLQPAPAPERLGRMWHSPSRSRARIRHGESGRCDPRRACGRSTSRARRRTAPTSCRQANSSASLSRARSSGGPRSSSRTSRPENLDFATGTEILDRLWRSCHEEARPWCSSPTTRRRRPTRTASSCCTTGRSATRSDWARREDHGAAPLDRAARRPGSLGACARSTRSPEERWSRGRCAASSPSSGSPWVSGCWSQPRPERGLDAAASRAP